MLGLGNRLNKSRVYKTFVGAAAVYENVIAEGSFGQGGYVISYDIDETSSPAQITYTEVYPSAVVFSNDSSTETALTGAQYIHDTLDYVYQEGTDTPVVYDDYRMAYPADVSAWLEHVYPFYTDDYYSSNSGNQYISVSSGFYTTWQGGGFIIQPGAGQTTSFFLHETNSSQSINPSTSQLESGSFYFLAVRTFTENLQVANQTPLPASNPEPTEPEALPYQFRNSGDLSNTVTSNPGDDDFDMSVNSQLLEGNEINMFLVGKTPDLGNLSPIASDRYKVQLKLKFPVNQSTSVAYELPEPWSPSNTEQKKAIVKYVVLGWKDFPFINHPLDLSDPSVLIYLLDGSITAAELIEYSNKVITEEINLNKVTTNDISSNSNAIGLPDGSGGFVDGYYIKGDGSNEVEFAYIGYIDLADVPASHITGIQEHSAYSIADATLDSNPIYIASDDRRYFLVRVLSVSFGSDQRPFSEEILFPEDLKYILVPITTPNSFGIFHNLISDLPDPSGSSAGFINYMYSASSGQNPPPDVGGDNEDYYN